MQKDFFKTGKQTLPSTTSGNTGCNPAGDSFEKESTISGTKGGAKQINTAESFSGIEGDTVSRRSRLTPNTRQKHNTIRVNYNFVCDLERFEKFKTFMSALADCKRFSRFLQMFLEHIKNYISCDVPSVFILKEGLLSYQDLTNDVLGQKTVLDGKYIDMVGL